jgi:hypothetical protein
MDNHLHFDKVDDPDTDVSFKLMFRKAREREPATRKDFQDVQIRLVGDAWSWQVTDGARQEKLSPVMQKFYDALCQATVESGTQMFGSPAASFELWQKVCVQRGLIDPDLKPASARAKFSVRKLELITRNWISCNETMAWTIGPNPQAGVAAAPF